MKNDIRKVLREYWDDQPDKWGLLEMDVRALTDKIIERHKDNWDGDQYAVIDAIQQVFEGMFEKVRINEVVDTVRGGEEKLKDSGNTLIGSQYYRGYGDKRGYYAETINKDMFFKLIKAIVQYTPWEKIEELNDDEAYRWAEVINPIVKVFGIKDINYSPDGLGTRIWFTIKNPKNYDGIKDGTITNANQLEIPERKTFEVYMETN